MFKITDKIEFVGKIDWQLRKFHGEQLSTNKGSSYNAFLIKSEKNVLIDTVWRPFVSEFIDNLRKEIDLNKIDYIVALHAEPDHSSALPDLLELIPDTPVYCTANGIKSLKGYYHKDWNFVTVKTGDVLKIGNNENITFIEIPMLHWPDQMMAYYNADNVLFSSDAFGQHYSSEFMFDDKVDMYELLSEALKYYANIVAPYSVKVTQKLKELQGLNLPIKCIAPAHGVLWRNNINIILEKYAAWANSYQENQITIIYDSMYGSTRRMAESIAEGIRNKTPDVNLKLFNAATSDSSDIVMEVFKSKAILVGSSTYNSGILNSIAGILEEFKGMKMKNKKAAAFGSYGWAPMATKILNNLLKECNFILMDPSAINAAWNPNSEDIAKCIEFGENFAEFVR